MATFKRATRTKQKARIAISGVAKAGKTTTALALATGICGVGGRIAVIDTEHGSVAKTCAGYYQFDSIEIDQFDPRILIDLIQAAEKEGYDAVIIDSLSHFWMGKGGVLELADQATARSRSGNSYVAWKDVTPLHQALIEAIIASKCHIIATMRAKAEYSLETDPNTGKTTPKKIGMAAVQREGMEFEFDILMRIDQDHTLVVEGSRFREIDGTVIKKPGTELGEKIGRWLDEGETPVEVAKDTPAVARLKELIVQANMTDSAVRTALARRGVATLHQLTTKQAEEMIANLEVHINNETFKNTFPHVEPARKEAEDQAAKYAERQEAAAEPAASVAG